MIYVCSRTKHAPMWRRMADGFPIGCSWIHHEGEADSTLWDNIVNEVAKSTAVVIYARPEDFPLKGAFVEVGVALCMGIPVYAAFPEIDLSLVGSWVKHSDVEVVSGLDTAMYLAGKA